MQMTKIVHTRGACSEGIPLSSEMRAAVSPDMDMDGFRKKSSNRVVLTRCLNASQSHQDSLGRQSLPGNAGAIHDQSNRNERISETAEPASVTA